MDFPRLPTPRIHTLKTKSVAQFKLLHNCPSYVLCRPFSPCVLQYQGGWWPDEHGFRYHTRTYVVELHDITLQILYLYEITCVLKSTVLLCICTTARVRASLQGQDNPLSQISHLFRMLTYWLITFVELVDTARS